MHKTSQIKARIHHTCTLCEELIPAESKYERQIGRFDGEFFCHKFHLSCAQLIDDYCDHYQESEYTFDAVLEWIADRWCYACEDRDVCRLSVPRCSVVLDGEKGGVDEKH